MLTAIPLFDLVFYKIKIEYMVKFQHVVRGFHFAKEINSLWWISHEDQCYIGNVCMCVCVRVRMIGAIRKIQTKYFSVWE